MSSSLDQMIRNAITSSDRRTPAPHARVPQVSLLPAEIRGDAQGRRIRLAAIAGVGAVALAVVGVVGLAGTTAGEADARASAATSRLAATSAQLAKFNDVRALQQHIALAESARRVGASTAIDWQKWTGLILADMPAGYSIQSITAAGATPTEGFAQGSSPLEQPRAAAVTVTVKAPSITELPIWLRKLKSLPAYADLTPTVSDPGEDGSYTVQVLVHLTTAAYKTPLKGIR